MVTRGSRTPGREEAGLRQGWGCEEEAGGLREEVGVRVENTAVERRGSRGECREGTRSRFAVVLNKRTRRSCPAQRARATLVRAPAGPAGVGGREGAGQAA